MSITYDAEGVKRPKLRYRIVSAWLKQIVGKFNFTTGDLSYIFCNDEYLINLNTKYLNHDFYTDIVTFDYCTDKVISGDMFISLDRVKENAVLYECNESDELLRVIVHGLLHLLKCKDGTDIEKKVIREMENECIVMFKELDNGCIK